MDSAWMVHLKRLLYAAAAAGAIWVLGWGYWHFKIASAVDALDTGVKWEPAGKEPPFIVPDGPADDIQNAGTRALPYLVGRLDAKRNRVFLLLAGEWVRGWLKEKDPTLNIPAFHLDDEGPALEAKVEEHRAAWKRIGQPRHKGWMWWKHEDLPQRVFAVNYVR
jgi:hypothetical protein